MNLKTLTLQNFQKHSNLKLEFSEGVNVIEGETDSGKCLSGETLIPNPITGERSTIKELINKPEYWQVWSLNKQGKLGIKNIEAIASNGYKKVYELETISGKKIVATGNHKFLGEKGWQKLEKFNNKDFIAVPNKIPTTIEKSKINIQQARILGYLAGDGSTTKSTIGFTNADKKILEDFKKCLKSFCKKLYISEHIKKTHTIYYISKGFGYQNRNIGKSELCKFVVKHGLYRKKSKEKKVPEIIYKSNNKIIKHFLGALFDCDGTVNISKESVAYASSSKDLIYGVQHLLLRLGIESSIHFGYKTNNTTDKKFPYYRLLIYRRHTSKILKNIYVKGAKKRKLKIIKNKEKKKRQKSIRYRLPITIAKKINNFMKQNKLTAKEIRKKSHMKPRHNYLSLKGKGFCRHTAKQIAKVLNVKKLKNLIFNDIQWDTVKSVKYKGIKPTYDIQVQGEDKNFIANDIIVHNSCCVRALAWILYNSGKTKDLVKEGTNTTSATAEFDNGVTVKRFKTKSDNGYELTIKGKKKRFDAVGRGVPKQIQKALQIKPIEVGSDNINLNIDKQIDIPFLIGQTDGFKAKLFNKLTGSEIIDHVLKTINSDKLESKRKIKNLEENLEKYDIKEEQIKESQKEISKLLKTLDKTILKAETAESLKEYQKCERKIKKINNQIKKAKKLDISNVLQKKEKYTGFKTLKKLENKIKEIKSQIGKNLDKVFKKFEGLKKLQYKLKPLKELKQILEKQEKVENKHKKTKEKLEQFKKKYKKTLKDKGICPVCKQDIKEIEI